MFNNDLEYSTSSLTHSIGLWWAIMVVIVW